MITRHGRRFGFEFKHADEPRMTKSMHVAVKDLGLEDLYVVHPGVGAFPLAQNVTAVGLSSPQMTLGRAKLLAN